jgi:hypothetical protein
MPRRGPSLADSSQRWLDKTAPLGAFKRRRLWCCLGIHHDVVYSGDVLGKTADVLSSATLIILLKKDAPAMEEVKARLGPAYVKPQRPIGMGTAIAKVACNCALLLVKEAMFQRLAPHSSQWKQRGGCLAAMGDIYGFGSLVAVNLGNTNAFGDIERECIRAAIKANAYLHSLLPLFELL